MECKDCEHIRKEEMDEIGDAMAIAISKDKYCYHCGAYREFISGLPSGMIGLKRELMISKNQPAYLCLHFIRKD